MQTNADASAAKGVVFGWNEDNFINLLYIFGSCCVGHVWSSPWCKSPIGIIKLLVTTALTIAQYIRGTSERARLIRRNCVRYMIVAQAMVFRDVSPAIRRRFPTMGHLVKAGLLSEDELVEFDAIKSPQSKYWQPIQWLFSLVTVAKEEGLIADSFLYVDLIDVRV
uniref:Bestrophin homolog n=1 Tax=Caenorhabditis japonica TaxID=281687 RepID=A0A8R1I9C6_CAEJA